MKRDCFSVWQRNGAKPGASFGLPAGSARNNAGYASHRHCSKAATALQCKQTSASASDFQELQEKCFEVLIIYFYLSCRRADTARLASYLNMAARVSDLSVSAMLTPGPGSCTAWYNFASSVWDSSGWGRSWRTCQGSKLVQGEFMFTFTQTRAHTQTPWPI